MPNRMLKESICTSENIDVLTSFQETVFYRLIVHCDDYGRIDARPKLLSSILFPLKDIRTNQIEDALRALASAELVTLYKVDGKPFLQMNTWNRHQRVRDCKEKYPGPDKADIEEDRGDSRKSAESCGEFPQIAADCCEFLPISNPIQSKTNPNPKPKQKCADARFESFWSAYPRHTNKDAARKAFAKVNPSDELMQTMLSAIEKQKKSEQWNSDGGRFIPHPATWLNGKRWEDELPMARSNMQSPKSPYKPDGTYDYESGESEEWPSL